MIIINSKDSIEVENMINILWDLSPNRENKNQDSDIDIF